MNEKLLFFLLVLVAVLWTIRQIKSALFWLYLWQLKDYLWGRLQDHFRTEKGRGLLINGRIVAKAALLCVFGFLIVLQTIPVSLGSALLLKNLFLAALSAVVLLYGAESAKAAIDIVKKQIKIPKPTKKTLVLQGALFLIIAGYGMLVFQITRSVSKALFLFLFFDLAVPALVSGVVFLFEPFAIAERGKLMGLAARKRASMSDCTVIGITGSYGKTSVKEFTAHILSQKFNVLKTSEHKNSEVGIAQTILEELTDAHEVFVCEMGAYQRGGIAKLAAMVRPNIGILTGINEQHMATFGSQQAIIDTKFELIEALPPLGRAIVNGDNDRLMRETARRIQTRQIRCAVSYCSAKKEADVWAQDIKIEKERLTFRGYAKDGDSAEFRVNVPGAHQIQNILLAAGAAKSLGMSMREIADACGRIPASAGAIRLRKGINGTAVIDSSYSANPDGVVSDLEYLALWEGKKIVVMPCLIELGSASKDVHERIGKKIAQVCDEAMIVTKERFADIQRAAMAEGMGQDHILYMENPKEIADHLRAVSSPGDAILIEGRVPEEITLCVS